MTELENIKTFNRWQRAAAAVDLWFAAAKLPNLKQELPYPSHGYGRDPLTGYRRLGRIAGSSAAHGLMAFTIRHHTDNRPRPHSVGMATAQKFDFPKPKPDQAFQPGIELSYWCAVLPEEAHDIGELVVRELIVASNAIPVTKPGDARWMVTLPDDKIKADVCQAVGLEPIGDPQRYDINDGVTRPRQLWMTTH